MLLNLYCKAIRRTGLHTHTPTDILSLSYYQQQKKTRPGTAGLGCWSTTSYVELCYSNNLFVFVITTLNTDTDTDTVAGKLVINSFLNYIKVACKPDGKFEYSS